MNSYSQLLQIKTDLNESTKMPLQSLTDFSTQMTFMEITSLEDLKIKVKTSMEASAF